MTDTPTDRSSEHMDPAESFAVLGNETRLAILQALWDAPERPVSFSDLRATVGATESAGFNYHLKKLAEHFIRKTEDGYDFRYAGEQVIRAILTGSFTEHPSLAPFDIEGSCVDCGGTLQARYEEETLSVECAECERLHSRYPFPPGALVDRDREEVLDAYDRWVRHRFDAATGGICAECGGRMDAGLVLPSDLDGETWCKYPLSVGVSLRCERCDRRVVAAVGMALLSLPAVAEFYRDHGVDLEAIPYWQIPWAIDDGMTTVVSTDPDRVAVAIGLDDDTMTVTLDPDLAVAEIERPTQGSLDGTGDPASDP